MTLEELTNSLKYGAYTPLTEDQIKAQAEAKYKAQYDQELLNAQQAYDSSANALNNQLAALEPVYQRNVETAQKNTLLSKSAADRQALSRGMQRSSYNNATLANIDLDGNKAVNALADALRASQNDINSQISLLAQQLAQNKASLQSNYNTNVNAYQDQLKEQDYQKKLAQDQYYNELQAMLYEYGLQSQQAASAARRSGGGGGKAGGDGLPAGGKDEDLLTGLTGLGAPAAPAYIQPLTGKTASLIESAKSIQNELNQLNQKTGMPYSSQMKQEIKDQKTSLEDILKNPKQTLAYGAKNSPLAAWMK